MSEVLNIDELTSGIERAIVIDGERHVMSDITVQDFMDFNAEMANAKPEEMGLNDQIEFSVNMIQRRFPTLDADVLKKKGIRVMGAINKFIEEADAAEAAAQSAEDVADAAEGKKPE